MSRTKRNLPKKMGFISRSLRTIKTTQERRMVAAALEQGVHVRPARNARRLPNSWDDFVVAAMYEEIRR